MTRYLDLASWKRRQHFEFFRRFEQPFFNITAEVDVTAVHRATKSDGGKAPGGPSFFLATLWLSLRAANAVEELRYRLQRGEDGEDRVVVHEVVHGGSTVLRPDETFVFAYFPYHPHFPPFAEEATKAVEEARTGPGLLVPHADSDDVIYYSVIPWVSFTSFSHARNRLPENSRVDSIPRIVFGKHRETVDGRRVMPVSLEVHHALADGLHVGHFFSRFQEGLDSWNSLTSERTSLSP